MNYRILFFALLVAFASCKKDKKEEVGPIHTPEEDDATIMSYWNYEEKTGYVKDEETGIYIQHLKEGTGISPEINDTISVLYAAYTITPRTPTEDDKAPYEVDVKDYTIGQFEKTSILKTYIKGWQLSIPKMKVGGKARILIPSRYAYNTEVYMFTVTLLDVKKGPVEEEK